MADNAGADLRLQTDIVSLPHVNHLTGMDIARQFTCIGLFAAGRYKTDAASGDVLSLIGRRERILSFTPDREGRRMYHLDLGFGEKINVYGHELVYLAAYGTYDPALAIEHADGDFGNNRLANLRTVAEYKQVAGPGMNRRRTGQERLRLPPDRKADMIRLHREGTPLVALAEIYSVSRQTVARIVNNPHVPD